MFRDKLKVSKHSETGQSIRQVRMFRNTFEKYLNVSDTSENIFTFRNTFEIFPKQNFKIFSKQIWNIPEHSGMFLNKLNVSEYFRKQNNLDMLLKQLRMFRNNLEIFPEHFSKYSQNKSESFGIN